MYRVLCMCNTRSQFSAIHVYANECNWYLRCSLLCHMKFVYFFWLPQPCVELIVAAPFAISMSVAVLLMTKDAVQLVNLVNSV